MASKSELLKSAEQAVALRSRWESVKGRKIYAEILQRIRAKDDSWVDLPKQLDTPEDLLMAEDSASGQLDDLRGIVLDNCELQNLDLSFIDFSFSFLRRANLKGACLQGSTFSLADLSGSNLSNADMLQIKCEMTRFDHSDLTSAILMASRCKDTSFHGANLTLALLDNCWFLNCDFKAANLTDAEMRKVRFDDLVISNETSGLKEMQSVMHTAIAHFDPQKFNHGSYWTKFRQVAAELVPTAQDLIKLLVPHENPEPIISDALFKMAVSWDPITSEMSNLIVKRCVRETVLELTGHHVPMPSASERDDQINWGVIVHSASAPYGVIWPEVSVVGRINKRDQEMFKCFYANGATRAKVAEDFGVTESHVKYQIEKVRKIIEQQYAAYGDSISNIHWR
ncbi:pentapeptide repeat-containing protein [Undibacterium sp. Tian12W]|uniref:pentapeptide repeat-containing protein n=1 Tax=Undibacterium sp. Tian12W TaxID=3413054 RepID=UPI003BEF8B95